jgi:D-alanyl-lipoteichoic acid acyltransferase DltB (MBOAT superfamily)
MSYTIEVYRGQQKAEKHLGYFANYVLFFPQMVGHVHAI